MVVHRSVLNDFLLKKKGTDSAKNAVDYNLSDLVKEHPWLTEKSFATIPTGASAADAKAVMERVTGCADVFVTTDGTKASAVTRWITNVGIFWKMTALLQPLSESPATPTAGPRNSMTAAGRRFFSKMERIRY